MGKKNKRRETGPRLYCVVLESDSDTWVALLEACTITEARESAQSLADAVSTEDELEHMATISDLFQVTPQDFDPNGVLFLFRPE